MCAAPKVSVLIPAYNYGHFLDETIQSVLDQTFTDFELVIVDNHSTDNTVAVVQSYLSDSRVSFYQNETNLGLVGNWNKCLGHAQGKYIKFLCADDKLHPQLLEKFVAVLDQHQNVALVSSYTQSFGRGSGIWPLPPYTGLVSGHLARERFIKYNDPNWLYAPTAVMFRKSGLQVGPFNAQLFMKTDKEFYIRLLATGDCYVIPEVLSYMRVHGATQTARMKKTKFEPALDTYWYFVSIKKASATGSDTFEPALNAHIKESAASCAAIMYKLMPKLHKKKNRVMFWKFFRIGYTEGVLLAPMLRLAQRFTKRKSLV